MEFIHEPYQADETVAAIATPPGEGGVSIIRISGKDAIEVAQKVFSGSIKKYASHTVHYGKIQDEEGKRVDDVLILPMLAPRSYTGEDTVEIFCHGGSLITRRVLDVILKAGARAARPGEFTFKAFIHGKIDLAQAEAVQELIGAKNEYALNAAEKQLEGVLSREVKKFQEDLTLIAAILEAWVDFPEEGLEFASFEEILNQLIAIRERLDALIATFHDGRILHEGLSLCIVGAPNVGKSSLMNALLDKDRAIVSPIAGTTRDILEDQMRLSGLNFRILDTAGIRETSESVEKEGIRRTHLAMEQADLILVVQDVEKAEHLPAFFEEIPKEKAVLVWNKADLPHSTLPSFNFPHVVIVSALKRSGLKELKEEINKVIWKNGPPSKEEVIVTNIRHHGALKETSRALCSLIEGLYGNTSPEFLTLDIRGALQGLGKILGTNVGEDILDAIFSTFCIGK